VNEGNNGTETRVIELRSVAAILVTAVNEALHALETVSRSNGS
jgi:hypothetical protein